MKQTTLIFFRYRVLAALLIGLLFASAGMAETLRISLQGQLADNGEPAKNDYDNATLTGFIEIDLQQPLSDGSNNRLYNMSSWDISLLPAPPNANGAEVIRFASSGAEPDDRGELTLNQSNDRLIIINTEDNSPENPRALFALFDTGVDITAATLFEELLANDNQLFLTRPLFAAGGMQFAVGTTPTGVDSADLDIDNGTATRYVDGNSGDDQGGGNSCALFDNPCATIQQAIDSASPGDAVQIADAVYTEILQVDKPLTFSGASRAGTIIQAAANRGDAADRTMTIAEDVPVQLSDLTIRHGNTGQNGGGLRSFGGDLLIERVAFTGNDADGQGAGLASGENVIVMNDVVFRDNGNSNTSQGGGARLGGNSVLTDVTMANVVFESNTAAAGGGLDFDDSQVEATDVAFVDNFADGNGGGLSYRSSTALALTNAVFVGNEATDFGGGMYTEFDTPYTLVNALFSGNLADLGGGLYNQGGTDGERIFTNVTMTGNRAMGDGGRGGGIDRPIDMVLQNTIIWNNQDELGIGTARATMNGTPAEVSNSLLQSYAADEFPGSGNLDGTLPGNNPLFISTVNPTGAPSLGGDLRLQQTSPVRDQGNNSFVAGVATDLDGEDRIFNGIVDLGPYEGTDVLFADGFEDSLF